MPGDHDAWLARRMARLAEGPTIDSFGLPPGITLVEVGEGIRFRGDARALISLAEELRKLERTTDGGAVQVGRWTLAVDDETRLAPRMIAMPWHAWGIAASKFGEVATCWEESPFDFSRCGYLVSIDGDGNRIPAPSPDVGVELVGDPLPR